ncbi:MAG: AraC family transcriptional regulator [Candidatus Binataceae bacterium]|jgi:AraC-like DNA-binding protein
MGHRRLSCQKDHNTEDSDHFHKGSPLAYGGDHLHGLFEFAKTPQRGVGIGRDCITRQNWWFASSRQNAWQFTTKRLTIRDNCFDNSRQGGAVVAVNRFGVGSGRYDIIRGQFGAAENKEASQRVGPLAEIPGLLREFGANIAEVLASVGLDADALDSLENRISFVAVGRLLHECAVKTRCQHFALLAGQRARGSHLGLPGQLVLCSPTLGAAIRTFAAYQHLNSQGMATYLLEENGVATLGSVVYQRGPEHIDQIYDFSAEAALSLMRELCGTHWRPGRVLFAHTKPTDGGPYSRFFQAPCRFDCERTALVFPAIVLQQRLPGADPKRFRMLEAQAQAWADVNVAFWLRRSLRIMLLAEAASADEVAKRLSMHRRTLNRRLKAEGTTFQQLLDEVRFETACQLLDMSRTPITEIAVSLGYAEPSAFSRAFRRWSGTTPVERRRRSQGVTACSSELQ